MSLLSFHTIGLMQLLLISAEIWGNIDFLLMAAILGTLASFRHMGLDTLIVELCALLAEIWRNIHFPVMVSLICIKMVCGPFSQLLNIANRFLWYFSNLET